MVIREGVTVITGGGYSGKSTLLDSMLLGIYNHVAGDGREFCISRENCCKIMNEEGRAISNLDISAFLKNSKLLNTESFSTLDASGSTSQAANIMEAISFGVNTLFIDEDRTATNFMIRDRRMRQLIKNDPIVPFTDRVKELYEQLKISTVLVIGGSSEYLDIADYVYIMEDYFIKNITSMVRENLQNCISDSSGCDLTRYRLKRYLKVEAMCTYIYDSENRRFREELAIRKRKIIIGNFSFDVSKLSTILSEGQVAAIAFIIRLIVTEVQAGTVDICEKVDEIYERIVENGLSFVYTNKFEFWPELELPNKLDVMFAISRLRVRNDGSESGEEKLALRKQT